MKRRTFVKSSATAAALSTGFTKTGWAVPADEDVAKLLKVPFYEPLILAQVNYSQPDGLPLQTVYLYMKPEYFKYRVDLDAKGI